jgi:hypothetical protein
MVQVITGRGQGFAGEVSGSIGQLVQGSLQVVGLLPFVPYLLPVESLPVTVIGLQGGD